MARARVPRVRHARQHSDRKLAGDDAAAAGLFQSFVTAELIQEREKLLDRDERGEPIAHHFGRRGQAQ